MIRVYAVLFRCGRQSFTRKNISISPSLTTARIRHDQENKILSNGMAADRLGVSTYSWPGPVRRPFRRIRGTSQDVTSQKKTNLSSRVRCSWQPWRFRKKTILVYHHDPRVQQDDCGRVGLSFFLRGAAALMRRHIRRTRLGRFPSCACFSVNRSRPDPCVDPLASHFCCKATQLFHRIVSHSEARRVHAPAPAYGMRCFYWTPRSCSKDRMLGGNTVARLVCSTGSVNLAGRLTLPQPLLSHGPGYPSF